MMAGIGLAMLRIGMNCRYSVSTVCCVLVVMICRLNSKYHPISF